jgi:hypothetical protein
MCSSSNVWKSAAKQLTAGRRREREDLRDQLAAAEDDLVRAQRRLAANRSALAAAVEVRRTQEAMRSSNGITGRAGRLHRRSARRGSRDAADFVRDAQRDEAKVRAEAAAATLDAASG